MPALIDAYDRTKRREIIPLLGEAIVKEHHSTVQKYDRRSVTMDLGVQLGAPHLKVALSAIGIVRNGSQGDECGKSS